ncbi:MAG TPA: wax ester/triacylglycerol synthase family O-acyltransferase [Thermoanaerobaculia bacterium]|nr:wax ester/triacylglycerol synthase family O-acyltransferase [Thermoanaerobaculia bacterium]
MKNLVQLSGLDAGFLALESPRAPMTVGGLSILDPGSAPGGLDVDRFRAVLRERLHLAVAFRRRLAALPLDLARPYWSELDLDAIDLSAHVERTELPAPGGWRELSALMAWQLAQPLDRGRPLWHMTFVDGVRLPDHPRGSVALVAVIHHAAIDGVSGAEILGALFDAVAPTATNAGAAEAASAAAHALPSLPADAAPQLVAEPVALPGVLELLARTGRDLAAAPAAATKVAGRSLLGLAAGAWGRLRSDETPPLPFSAPRSPLNRPLSGRLAWAPATIPLDRIKAIKSAADASVNDAVLAIVAGALRGWLADRGELPEEPLVAMVPISVRADEQRRQAGNQVSAMLVPLATDEPDPRARLLRIRDASRGSKVAHQAVGARTLLDSAGLLPFALTGLGAQLYSRLHLAERHRPVFNVVVTNVPGPPRPLTIAGAPLLAHFGSAPLYDGLGLIVTVMSYAGTVSFGVTADHAAMSDAAGFAGRLAAAAEELAA